MSKVKRLRFIWAFWMWVSIYAILVPFTAEFATLPMIGGLLIALESQTAVMMIFAFCLTYCNYAIYVSIIWLHYKPVVSLVCWIGLAAVLTCMFKLGESVPVEYARYKLGYF